MKDGVTTGAASSMDRLSKYYIDRAESLQPIVEIGAGRYVDVIFTEGVFFGSSELKKAIAKKRDELIKRESGSGDISAIRQLN
jgi:conjugal transfer pilus assembly protein TraB